MEKIEQKHESRAVIEYFSESYAYGGRLCARKELVRGNNTMSSDIIPCPESGETVCCVEAISGIHPPAEASAARWTCLSQRLR